MKTGSRKFLLTVLGLISFTLISCISGSIDFISLGLGVGFILTPNMAANAFEHKFQQNKEQNNV
jgi:hypothetical protein